MNCAETLSEVENKCEQELEGEGTHTLNLCQPIETAVVGQSPEQQITVKEEGGKRDEEGKRQENDKRRGGWRSTE